jgi:hypothetical protein
VNARRLRSGRVGFSSQAGGLVSRKAVLGTAPSLLILPVPEHERRTPFSGRLVRQVWDHPVMVPATCQTPTPPATVKSSVTVPVASLNTPVLTAPSTVRFEVQKLG